MFMRLVRIFDRYVDRNLKLERPGLRLQDAAGRHLGQLETYRLEAGRIVAEGLTSADRLGLTLNRSQSWEEGWPKDATESLRPFHLDMPYEAGTVRLLAEQAGVQTPLPLPEISVAAVRLARLRLAVRFVWDLLRLAPQIWRWRRLGDMGAREVVKEQLGLVPRSRAYRLEDDLFETPPPAPAPSAEAADGSAAVLTIVMPVYNAFDVLQEALQRLEAGADAPWRLILIEDCSTDPAVRPFLQDWAQDPLRASRVELVLNTENLGFVGAVNRGFEAARRWPQDPVLLLNSDALLPRQWTRRLLAPLADPQVASVTPMSNDAEIFTVPVQCQRHDLAPSQGDQIDQVAQRLSVGTVQVSAPTGVGFCMVLAPQFLADIPAFDPVFGRGYGEETDWCQKARARGGRHVAARNLFVEHRGGASFGQAAKQAALQRNGRRISQRYPSYDQEVQRFIAEDPLCSARLALGLAWAGSAQTTPVSIYLGHALGGGAEHYLRDRIAAEVAAGQVAVVLRVGQRHRWRLELHTAQGVVQGLCEDWTLVEQLLAPLSQRKLVYSCGVGDRCPVEIPARLLALAGHGLRGQPPCPIEVLMHDYFPISPSYTLTGSDGQFHGVPRPQTSAGGDPAHQTEGALAQWQQSWGKLLEAAAEIRVFSQASETLLRQAYPQLGAVVQVCPHVLPHHVPQISAVQPAEGGPVIGVLGNIGAHKGAAVLQQLSRHLNRTQQAKLVVIGNVDPAFALARGTQVHGSYELRDLPGLVARYRISGWLIPSVWPETFSFTTHEALATGMPVFAFDLGAQGEAVARATGQGARGAVLPLQADGSAGAEQWLSVMLPHLTGEVPR